MFGGHIKRSLLVLVLVVYLGSGLNARGDDVEVAPDAGDVQGSVVPHVVPVQQLRPTASIEKDRGFTHRR